MNSYEQEAFIAKVMRDIRASIPYPATVEDYVIAEKLINELEIMLSSVGYHIAKYSLKNKKVEE